ncbi:MAG: DUF6158 family protein [Actinomycetota bacterium]|nr:DUF6158 family protein [Actinomycetota bacterium]
MSVQGTTESGGKNPAELTDEDLFRELANLHRMRHETFLHGSDDALSAHTRRMLALEEEYTRRNPGRQVDPERTREGARERD